MKVVLINYAHVARDRTPEAVVNAFPTLEGWAVGLRNAGAEVAVVVGFTENARLHRNDIDYRFVAGHYTPHMSPWRWPRRLHRVIGELRPDVVHLNGLLYGLQARGLRGVIAPTSVVVGQHHAGQPPTGWRRRVQRWGWDSADGFLFAGQGTAAPWVQAGLITPAQPIRAVSEGSTRFEMADRQTSRAASGLNGEPVCLWLGNLNRNKDPLTVLNAFDDLLARRAGARLYMAFREAPLKAEVEARIARSARLSTAVRMLGPQPPARIELLLNSADFLLQGSAQEGSGFVVIEALACGVVPIVTKIPSFEFLTRNGEFGVLWPPGDAHGLASALRRAWSVNLEHERRRIRAHFEQALSFDAIGREAVAFYGDLLAQREIGPATPGPETPMRTEMP